MTAINNAAATYTSRYTEGRRSAAMSELIALRGEDAAFVGADAAGNELYRFPDSTEVIVTNAGIVAEDEPGFAADRASILGA